jgi:ribosome-binding protein aMBF1 (putative translation factor)
MSKESFKVKINPAIIKWARESAGWSVEEVSKKKLKMVKKLPTLGHIKILAF